MALPEHLVARAVAAEAARAGGQAALARFRRGPIAVETKPDQSPVTIADREAEAACKAIISAACPADAWLGEESGASTPEGGDGRRIWIVDPIDGTKNFIRGIPLWSTLVACAEIVQGRPRVVASAVHVPALGELYDAVLGGGARLDGSAIRTSTTSRLADGLFCYETPAWFSKSRRRGLFERMCAETGLQRGGGDAYFHMLVASGRAEVVIEPELSIWDIAATSLIVCEAGGGFRDLAGNANIGSGSAVLINGPVMAPVMAIIAEMGLDPAG